MKLSLLKQDVVKVYFENLAKLLKGCLFVRPFCLCAPGCFCFIAFNDGLKIDMRDGGGKGNHILGRYELFLFGKQQYPGSGNTS